MHCFRIGRSGLTLIETLVVIAFLAVLVAVLLPALLRVRERDSQARCLDNLRQLALACHKCNDTLGSLPPYSLADAAPKSVFGNTGRNNGSMLYALLPFLDMGGLYQEGEYTPNANPPWTAYDCTRGKGLPDGPEAPFFRGVRAFLCPSDPTAPRGGIHPSTNWGVTSYGGNFLVFGNPNPKDYNDPDYSNEGGQGATFGNLARIPISFPDGMSMTILYMYAIRPNDGAIGGEW